MKKLKRDSLLNKIMRVLAKLMGINIKNNSLYAQEFEAIRNAIDSTAEIIEEIDNKNEKLDNKNEQDNVKQEQEIEPEKDEDKNVFDKDAFIYVIAVSLQVAGALLLLCYNVSAKQENIIKSFEVLILRFLFLNSALSLRMAA